MNDYFITIFLFNDMEFDNKDCPRIDINHENDPLDFIIYSQTLHTSNSLPLLLD